MTSAFALLALLFATDAAALPPSAASSLVESPSGEQAALYEQAMADYKAAKCETAMPALKTLVETNFRPMESALALRECYLLRYQTPDAAVVALETEIKANPNDAVSHSNLGAFYMLQQKRDEAREEK